MVRDLGLEPKVVCTCDGVFPTSMSVLLELVALILSFARWVSVRWCCKSATRRFICFRHRQTDRYVSRITCSLILIVTMKFKFTTLGNTKPRPLCRRTWTYSFNMTVKLYPLEGCSCGSFKYRRDFLRSTASCSGKPSLSNLDRPQDLPEARQTYHQTWQISKPFSSFHAGIFLSFYRKYKEGIGFTLSCPSCT